MNPLLICVLIILLYVLILRLTAPLREKIRIQKCTALLETLNNMLKNGRHSEILDIIKKDPILKWEYKLPSELRSALARIKLECFEKLNKIDEAVADLSSHLASTYEKNQWPSDLYNKWLSLYKSIEPLPVEKFYFCRCCGLHPDEKELLESAIAKGCRPPIGYPGESKSAEVIHFPIKKAKAT